MIPETQISAPHEKCRVSVVICTFNRCDKLRVALEKLTASCVPSGVVLQILVVDNGSTDKTRDVIGEFETRLPLRYVFEASPGLSVARNRAIEECEDDDILLFTDDDVRVSTNWIAAIVAAAKGDPSAKFFGGKVVPAFRDGRPGWLGEKCPDLLDGLFVSYDLGPETRRIQRGDILPVGANMGFRLSCFEEGFRFREDLGVVGRDMGRGEDTEMIQRLLLAEAPGLYVADAECEHDVDAERLTFTYAFRYGQASGGHQRSYLLCISFVIRGLRQLLLGRGDRARQCAIRAGMSIGRRQH